MHVEMLSENNRDRVEIEFSIFPRNGEEFTATGKEFRRSAFVGMDVSALMTDRALEWAAKLGEGKRVGGGAVENEKRFAVGLKNFAKLFAQLVGPTVSGVGDFGLVVRFEKRAPRFRTNSCGIIAREVVAIWDRHSVP
jgi:hypothetical protein